MRERRVEGERRQDWKGVGMEESGIGIGRWWGWKRVGLGLEGGGVGRKWDWDWKGAKLEGLVGGER